MNTEHGGKRPWVVCQLGAREHYAIQRALHRAGRSTVLMTDYWSSNRSPRFLGRLVHRNHPEVAHSQVVSFNWNLLLFEALVRLKRLDQWEQFLQRGEWFGSQVAKKLPSIVADFGQPPIVFAYSYAAASIFKAAKSLGCPTVLGQIDPGREEERIVSELYRKAGFEAVPLANEAYWRNWQLECSLADTIVVNSEWSYEGLLKSGIDKSKIKIVELAYERYYPDRNVARVFPKEFTRSRPLRVLFLGQVNVRKGIIELARSMELLRDEPIEWIIVGGGDLDESNLFPSGVSVRRVNQVSRLEVETYYSNADIFILPTHSDGFAITLLEAASVGLPIISSRYCGQVVKHMENGLLLDSVSPEAICKAVKWLLSNPAEIERMSKTQSQKQLRTIDDLGSELTSLFP